MATETDALAGVPPEDDNAGASSREGVASPGDGGARSSQPTAFAMPQIDSMADAQASRAIELLADVNLNVKIELGRTRMLVEDVLRLSEGAVVELDKLAGDPVDIYVNERHVARGEVLVLNDNFCVRVNEVLSASDNADKR